ncbi:hypothetical protein BLA29_001650 [Euroglyphus maynei]|uniref:Uncharacterized protein n=1 Tax=Euroglyphus maynei TaxID=6958 RepID=A0A1Y3AYD5_EURMA|nr:hypothetical protein BLA29_001650 [Euroglyphus maynei]
MITSNMIHSHNDKNDASYFDIDTSIETDMVSTSTSTSLTPSSLSSSFSAAYNSASHRNSLISLSKMVTTIMALCILMMTTVHCASISSKSNDATISMLAKRSIPQQQQQQQQSDWPFTIANRPLEACQQIISAILTRDLAATKADAERLDSIWKDLKGIRYKKQNGKIVQIKSRKNRNSANSNNKDSRLNKRMILFLLNLSVAKPLLERIQSKQQLKRLEEALKLYGQIQQQKNESRSTSSSSLDHLSSQTPFEAESFSNSNLDLLSQQSIEENESDFMPSMFGTHFTRSPQSFPSSMMTTATMKVTTPIATKTNHQHETGQTTVSQSSRLVETDRPMLETPRSKKLLSQTMILRANPWDKEGIRFKRNIFNHQSRIDLSSQTGKFSLSYSLNTTHHSLINEFHSA